MRYIMMILLAASCFSHNSYAAETSKNATQLQTPADYILLTVFLRHDQSRKLDDIIKHLDEQQFWGLFPPEGIEVESWYIMMGVGHVVMLRVPPARLREVNLAVEKTAWGSIPYRFSPPMITRNSHSSVGSVI